MSKSLLTTFTETKAFYNGMTEWAKQSVKQAMHYNLRTAVHPSVEAKPWIYQGSTNSVTSSLYSFIRITKPENKKRGAVLALTKAQANMYENATHQLTDRYSPEYVAVYGYINYLNNTYTRLIQGRIEPSFVAALINKHGGKWEMINLCSNYGYRSETFERAWNAMRHLHCLHISTEDTTKVAYFPSLRALRTDRPLRTTMGKYLTKFAAVYGLDETGIKDIAERHASIVRARVGWAVKYVEHDDPNGWVSVYSSDKVGSCMRGESAVRVYAHEKSVLRLAYLVDGGGDVIARCIVRDDDDKGWLRVYPDPNGSAEGRFLLDSIKADGYVNEINLDGVLLKAIEANSGYVCPYLDRGDDGSQSVSVVYKDGSTYLEAGGGDINADNTNGYTDSQHSCDCCGDSVDSEDDLAWIECDEQYVCEYCRDNAYTYAYGSGRHQDYYRSRDCIEVNGEYYHENYLSDHGIYACEISGEYYHEDDLIFFKEGVVCEDSAASIDHDHDGSSYCHPNYVHTLSDGTTCHDDDADEYQAEIDEENECENDEDNQTDVQVSEQNVIAA